ETGPIKRQRGRREPDSRHLSPPALIDLFSSPQPKTDFISSLFEHRKSKLRRKVLLESEVSDLI
ncbi:hypothetical protein AKJ16_DCAP09959, partial [Drosera capensis]